MEDSQPGNTGLSTCHIRSQETQTPRLVPAGVSWYTTGGLAKVTREQVEKPCRGCGEPFKVLKRKSSYTHYCKGCCQPGVRGWKRGTIHTFSRNSRRRLMRLLATVKKDVRPVLVTLTYPDSYEDYENSASWKRDLRAFEHRFRRAFPGASFIWRLEIVERKSGVHVGKAKPHFHLLVFGCAYQSLRKWVPQAWFEAVGTGDWQHLNAGTQVSQVRSRRGMFSYASKTVGNLPGELGKDAQTAGQDVGRWWGVCVRKAFQLFQSAVSVLELTEQQAVNVLRAFRRLSKAGSRDYVGLTAFCDGGWLTQKIAQLAEPIAGRNSFRTGRRYDVPFWKWAYELGKLVPEMG